jgi:hypothetical protein
MSGQEETNFSFGGESAPTGQKNILDRIKARTIQTVKAELVTFAVEERDGFAVAYSKYLPKERWDLFSKSHVGDKDRFAKAILLAQCTKITVDGETWLGKDGEPLTFTSEELWAAFSVEDGFEAITALYLLDPDVWLTAEAVLRECGWDLTKQLDPTKP